MMKDAKQGIAEREKYNWLWSHIDAYREVSPGQLFLPFFLKAFQADFKPGQKLIDFGCGTGRVARDFLALQLKVRLVDISPFALDEEVSHLLHLMPEELCFVEACLWQLPQTLQPADWIYCTDVLEHLPTKQMDQVLKGMSQRMQRGGYLSICLQEDAMGKTLGLQLHLTVQTRDWWHQKISQFFQIIAEDQVVEGLYFNCAIIKKEGAQHPLHI